MITRLKNLYFVFLVLVPLLFPIPNAVANNKTAQQNQIINAANKQQDAFDAALDTSTPGPAKIALGDQGTLNLPDNYFFIPPKEAANLLHTLGNQTGPEFMGLIIPKDHVHWFITIDYNKSGHIRDTDAKYWNSDELLDDIRKSTAEENEELATHGFPILSVANWVESPNYDNVKHILIWSVLGKYQNDTNDSNHESINYNTYLLGRDG